MSAFTRSLDTSLPLDPLKLTDAHLRALKPREGRYDRLVGGGLVLRVSPTGKVSFRYSYSLEGNVRVVTIGRWPTESLKALRSKWERMSDKVEQGEDVAVAVTKKKVAKRNAKAEAMEAKRKRKNLLTVQKLADLFMAHTETGTNQRGRAYSKKTRMEYRNHLLNHIIPAFCSVPVEELERKKIAAWLKEKAEKAPAQANHLLSTLGAMFSWAADEELTDANIVAGMKRPGGKPQSKTRALDFDPDLQEVVDRGEIRAFWYGLDDVNPLHRLALRLVLITALRPGEVLAARWGHILDDRWVIPVSATKNKATAHKIPLTPDVKKALKELRALTGETPYLFPQARFEEGKLKLGKYGKPEKLAPIETSTVSKVLRNRFDLEPFTVHDLRRTASTHLKALGFLEAEIGLLLHHTSGAVTAIYAQGDDMKRKQKMLNAWHHKLKSVLTGEKVDNVVPMRGA